jgi:hypothetical protein
MGEPALVPPFRLPPGPPAQQQAVSAPPVQAAKAWRRPGAAKAEGAEQTAEDEARALVRKIERFYNAPPAEGQLPPTWITFNLKVRPRLQEGPM